MANICRRPLGPCRYTKQAKHSHDEHLFGTCPSRINTMFGRSQYENLANSQPGRGESMKFRYSL
ncbi:hypothetical protein IQ06DRAFT_80802 [Phaeosphaeriaceae sp. SRC1lsM3a]|nr:hypothetical protein IQ06DRAFT_80802 [Stagonospora sp. SRC1lsM3a]